MNNHTSEPWAYEAGKGIHEGTIVITSYTMSPKSPLAHISNICEDAEPDARRIVACVNACAGEPTGALEIFPYAEQVDLKIKFFDEANALRAQLKILTEDLKLIKENAGRPEKVYSLAKAAIAKCEAK